MSDKFWNDPANAKCKAFLTKDTSNNDDNCSGSSNSGASCAGLGVVGASAGCKTTSQGVKSNTKDLLDCQQRLFQNTVEFMIEELLEGDNDLFQILQDEAKIYKLEINTAKEKIDGEIKVLEIVSLFSDVTVIVFLSNFADSICEERALLQIRS